ncbi:hypothetical protein KDAU_51520 [Dictyobacter aurantiacus]|uniref:Uncharacterized protein n=1 Tax=Dictyobacter aurantiacus TaxID=1936993 RepID=A0A401ZLT9_9CHLR|nr:hypothetical protein KDAU_51520 [Dictyobacter aurantiacus]
MNAFTRVVNGAKKRERRVALQTGQQNPARDVMVAIPKRGHVGSVAQERGTNAREGMV